MGHRKVHPSQTDSSGGGGAERNPDFLTGCFQITRYSFYRDWSSLSGRSPALVLFYNKTVVGCSLKGRRETHATLRMFIPCWRGARRAKKANCCLDTQRPVCSPNSRMRALWRVAGVSLCSKVKDPGVWGLQVTTGEKTSRQEGTVWGESKPCLTSAFQAIRHPVW